MKNNSFDNIKEFLYRDVKEFNSYILSFVCIGIIMVAGLISYFMTNSFAWFTQVLESDKNINVVVDVPTFAVLTTGENFQSLLRSNGYRNFKTITVLTDTTVDKSKADAVIDVSVNQDGSVEAIIVDDEMMPLAGTVGGMNLYIVTAKEILYANPESSYLFSNNEVATSIDVSSLNTSKVMNMSYMFAVTNISNITGLNTWDTSNVLNMSYMFMETYYDGNNFDLSNFDTRSVSKAEGMFCNPSGGEIPSVTSDKLTTGQKWTLTEADGLYTCPVPE